jgi:hypothetical protein
MSDVREAIEMSLSDDGMELALLGTSEELVQAVADKVRVLFTPMQFRVDELAKDLDRTQDEVENLEGELCDCENIAEERASEAEDEEETKEWLRLVNMFKAYGGFCHDARYGYPTEY